MFSQRMVDSLVLALIALGLSLGELVPWYAGFRGSFAALGLASFAFVLSAMAICFAVRDLRYAIRRWQAIRSSPNCGVNAIRRRARC